MILATAAKAFVLKPSKASDPSRGSALTYLKKKRRSNELVIEAGIKSGMVGTPFPLVRLHPNASSLACLLVESHHARCKVF